MRHSIAFYPAVLLPLLAGLTYAQSPSAQLTGFAVLPADTFTDGPPSGQFDSSGVKALEPRFSAQPVQGFSSVQFGETCNTFIVLSDNGFGTQANSPDYRLSLHTLRPNFETADGGGGTVEVVSTVTLHDSDDTLPFRIVAEATPERPLTGADFDLESFVVAADGSFWLGEEFGPYLLHIDAQGKLLAAPYSTPDPGAEVPVMSPQNPALIAAPPEPGATSSATLPRSKGFEGLALSPDKTRLYPLLEGTVTGDPEGTLRLYTFDLASQSYEDELRYYPLEDPSHAIGEITAVNDREFLVIERDNEAGDEATFKKIFKIDLEKTDAEGQLQKEVVINLLDIANPDGLGGFGEHFRFPFQTIESVLILDAQTLLVLNDNNYDATGGRGAEVKDPNEVITVQLARPLELATGVGTPMTCR